MTPDQFRSTLKAFGLSQRQFAARLGVNVNTVNRWALGTLPVPRYATYILELLAAVEAISITYHLTGD